MKPFYKLTVMELQELKNDLNYLVTTYQDHFVRQNSRFAELRQFEKFAHVLGYSGTAIYPFLSSRKLNKKTAANYLQTLLNVNALVKNDDKLQQLIEKVHYYEANISTFPVLKVSDIQEKETKPVVLEQLANTKWFLFERFEHTIGRRILSFGAFKKNGLLEVVIEPINHQYSTLEGTASCDSTETVLLIQASNRKKKSANSQFMIRVDTSSGDLSLLIGHTSFLHIHHFNVVTKTIILERIEIADPVPKEFKLDGISYDDVKEPIVRFLYRRSDNRLTSPHESIITNLESLSNWHIQNDRISKNDKLRQGHLGLYRVIYNLKPVQDVELVFCSLDLFTLHGHIHAKFERIFEDEIMTWEGEASVNHVSKTLSVLLHGPYDTYPKTGERYIPINDPIYLMFHFSSTQTTGSVCAGIITGVRDGDDGSVSRLIIAQKLKDKEQALNKENEEKVKKFFRAYATRSWVRSPKIKISNIEDLISDEVINQGEKSKERTTRANKLA